MGESDKDVFVRWFEDLTASDTPEVGGKNSSLGEMTRELAREGVRVPAGFRTALLDLLAQQLIDRLPVRGDPPPPAEPLR